MRFGVTVYPFSAFPDLPSLVNFVQQAEQLGYDYVTIPEHVAFPKEEERSMGTMWWDAIVLTTHLATVTSKIRYIFSVLVLPQHNPFYLAKSIATLDHISNGRVELGVGVGWLEDEFKILGADFHKRGALMVEYIKVMKALWTSDPSSYSGKYVSFSDVSSFPKPLQHPHPPIFIGGGAKLSVPRAIELGTGWMPIGTGREFKEGLGSLRKQLVDQGRSADELHVMRALPFAQPTAEMQEHYRASGSSGKSGFAGDLVKTFEYIRECEQIGVSHLTANFQADDFSALMVQLRRFAEGVIHPGELAGQGSR